MKFGGSPKCVSCGKTVFIQEQVLFDGNPYHKNCFRCTTCQKTLSVETAKNLDGKVLCFAHFNISKGLVKDGTREAPQQRVQPQTHSQPSQQPQPSQPSQTEANTRLTPSQVKAGVGSPPMGMFGLVPGGKPTTIQKRMFDKFDTDRDGSISPQELRNLLQSLGYLLSDQEMEWALRIIDKDASGTIEFEEFDAFYKSEGRFKSLLLNSEKMEQFTEAFSTFSAFDTDGNGTLDRDEFRAFINSLNGIVKSSPDEIFDLIDTDRSGTISFNEFSDFLITSVNKKEGQGFSYGAR